MSPPNPYAAAPKPFLCSLPIFTQALVPAALPHPPVPLWAASPTLLGPSKGPVIGNR